MTKLSEILHTARELAPPAELRGRSLQAIARTPQEYPWSVSFARMLAGVGSPLRVAFVAAAFVALIVLGGILRFGTHGRATLATQRALEQEAESLTFSIQLPEANYFKESSDDIAILLGEIRASSPPPTPIDMLLESVLF